MRTIRRLPSYLVAAAAALALGSTAFANGNGSLGFFQRETGKVDFATAAVHSADSGSITLSSVPAGAVIRKVYYYYATISGAIPIASTFAGVAIPAEFALIGSVAGISSSGRSRTFRNDVTSLVPGNGTYSFSRVTGGFSRGAALIVLYEDPTLVADYQIELHDGANAGGTGDGAEPTWPNPVTFTGFTVDGTAPREVQVAWLIQDGSPSHSENYLFARQADALVSITTGNPATLSMEVDRFDVSSTFLGGETQARASCSEGTDAILWCAGLLRVRITPPITDTTPPEITIASPADNAVVAGSPATVTICVRDESGTTITSVPPLVWSPSSFPMPTAGESTASLVLFEGANTLSVTATDAFGHATTRSATIRLDTIVPQVAITAPTDGAILGAASVTLTADVNDATATDVSSSPTGITTALPAGGGSVSGTVALAEGLNTVSVSATDEAGHAGGTSVSVIVDTTPPEITVTAPLVGAILGDSPVAVSVQVSDATATSVEFGGNTINLPEGGGTANGTIVLTEGTNSIVVTATDAAGNYASTSVDIELDSNAPMVTIDTPADGSCFGPGESPIALITTVDDATATVVSSAPAGLAASLPAGGGLATGAIELVEGANNITVTATDAAGRSSSAAITVLLDTTAPTATIESPLAGAVVRGMVEFHATASDEAPGSGVAHVDLLVDGQVVAALDAPPFEVLLDTTTLPDGAHELSAVASDGKGNAGTATSIVVVDNTPPDVTLGGLVDGGLVAGMVDFTAAASDGGAGLIAIETRVAGVAPTVDGSATYAPAIAFDTRFAHEDTTVRPDGALVFLARAVDAAGNESTTSVQVIVDNTAPTKSLITPTAGATVRGVIPITAEASDPNLDLLSILVDGTVVGSSSFSPLTASFDTRTRLDGAMQVTVVVRDRLGNTSACSVDVTVDNLSVDLRPKHLNLHHKAKGDPFVDVVVKGVNVALLLPITSSQLELRVPGGNPVAARTDGCCAEELDDEDEHGRNCRCGVKKKRLKIEFSRKELIASIQAGIAAHLIDPNQPVPVTLVAHGTNVIGVDYVRVSVKP